MAGVDDLLLACTVGDVSWLERALSRGSNPRTKTREGLNGLHLSAKHGMFDCMKFLLDNEIVDINEQAALSGDTALHCLLTAHLGKKTWGFVRLLLDNNASVDRPNKSGKQPIHVAAQHGLSRELQALLDHGADINAQDFEGHTAYQLACIHGRHKCARLLGAMHWGQGKDQCLSRQLSTGQLRRQRDKDCTSLSTRLRAEAAQLAYHQWLQVKNISPCSTPTACGERLQQRSRTSCTSCAGSKKHSAKPKPPKINSKIKIKPHQETRNTKSVGKPSQLYPYSNYPSKQLRSQARTAKSKHVTRAKSTEPTVDNALTTDPLPVEHETSSRDEWTVSDECSDEDLLFHDVGKTNNLEALALPSAITRDKSQGELIQLLRALGGPTTRTFNRSHSVISRRTAPSGQLRRRLSLSAIPEGKIVTSYSDDDQSITASQVLDDAFIAELIKTFNQPAVEEPAQAWEDSTPAEAASQQSPRRASLTLPLANQEELTLKVVNMEWDVQSNTVQTVITSSALTPPDRRQSPSPRASPTVQSI